MEHQHPTFTAELDKPSTMKYHATIGSMDEYLQLAKAYTTHIRKEEPMNAPEDDQTWPSTRQMELAYIKQVVSLSSIYDTSDFVEKTPATYKLAHHNRIPEDRMNKGINDTAGPSKKRKRTGQVGAEKKPPKRNPTEAVNLRTGYFLTFTSTHISHQLPLL